MYGMVPSLTVLNLTSDLYARCLLTCPVVHNTFIHPHVENCTLCRMSNMATSSIAIFTLKPHQARNAGYQKETNRNIYFWSKTNDLRQKIFLNDPRIKRILRITLSNTVMYTFLCNNKFCMVLL